MIGFVGGEIPTVQVNRLLLNNTTVTGVAWGAYALQRPGYIQQQWADLLRSLSRAPLPRRSGTRFRCPKPARRSRSWMSGAPWARSSSLSGRDKAGLS